MKKLLFILGMIFSITTIDAQEMPDCSNSVNRYDFKEIDSFYGGDGDYTYTVLVITNCITNEKEYKLMISRSGDTYLLDDGIVAYKCLLNDGVVAELLKAFHYLITTQFKPKMEDEKSFIIYEVCEKLYFKYMLDDHRLELLTDNGIIVAKINHDDEIEEFASLLLKIEKTFDEKGRDLKDAVISDENKKEQPMFLKL